MGLTFLSRRFVWLATAALAATIIAITISAQTPQPPQGGGNGQQPPPGGGGGMMVTTAPTNLKALPKDTSIAQLNQVMQDWKAAMGGHCFTCHSVKNQDSGGRPDFVFTDDSKQQFKVAREMYKMTEEINKKYLAESKAPVACSTCHRGHEIPEKYVAQAMNQPASGAPPQPAASQAAH